MARLETSRVETTRIVQPNDTNPLNVAHGGNVVKWMDEAGGLSAMRFSGEVCVTARMRRVDFHHPIELGNAAVLRSYVYRVGTTSLDVCIRVIAEEFREGTETLTTESYFTFVAIDDNHQPIEVPRLDVETNRERELQRKARQKMGDVESS